MEEITSQRISDKVFELTEQFHRYVFEHPEILDDIPDKAVLVFLDPDDPEFNRANIERSRALSHPEAGPPVYIEMRQQVRVIQQIAWEARIINSPIAA